MDEEELKKLSEQVRNLSREIQKTVKATKANKDQAEKIARDKIREARQQIQEKVKDKALRTKLNNELEDQIDNYQDLQKAQDKYREKLAKVGDSFVGLGKAAFEGSGSISAFTDNVKGLGLLGSR